MIRIISLAMLILSIISRTSNLFSQEDAERCYNNLLFTRMANLCSLECNTKNSYETDFINGKENPISIECKFHRVFYKFKEGLQAPNELQMTRNFRNAIIKISRKVIKDYQNSIFLTLQKDNKLYRIVAHVYSSGNAYGLSIIEKAKMHQKIIANAESIYNDIQANGHASIYSIYFDFNKSEIKPASEVSIRQIAKMLDKNINLKINVVSHTDNIGNINYNMKLSQSKAKAIENELITRYKIPVQRLKIYGVASLAFTAQMLQQYLNNTSKEEIT